MSMSLPVAIRNVADQLKERLLKDGLAFATVTAKEPTGKPDTYLGQPFDAVREMLAILEIEPPDSEVSVLWALLKENATLRAEKYELRTRINNMMKAASPR